MPALRQSRPRLPRYHLGRELAEQEQDRYRSGAPPQGIPGIRAGARRGFLFHFEEGTISLSRRGAAVSQPEILFPFPHRVTCQKQAKSSSDTSPPNPVSKTIREIFGKH